MKTTSRLRQAGDGKQIKPESNEAGEATPMYETENDLPKTARTELNVLIIQRLADAVDLQMQLKQAHWNVKGPHFIGLHQLFDEISEAVEGYVDLIAERIAHVEAVAKALSAFGREARMSIDEANALEDADTADMF